MLESRPEAAVSCVENSSRSADSSCGSVRTPTQNIGREASARLPSSSWGASGVRLPVKLEVDISPCSDDTVGAEEGQYSFMIKPRKPLVEYVAHTHTCTFV